MTPFQALMVGAAITALCLAALAFGFVRAAASKPESFGLRCPDGLTAATAYYSTVRCQCVVEARKP